MFSDSSSVMRFWREATESSSATSTVALIQFVCLDRKEYHRLPVSLKREQLSIRADYSNSNGKGKSKTALNDLRNMTFPALLRTIHSLQLLLHPYLSCSIVFWQDRIRSLSVTFWQRLLFFYLRGLGPRSYNFNVLCYSSRVCNSRRWRVPVQWLIQPLLLQVSGWVNRCCKAYYPVSNQ